MIPAALALAALMSMPAHAQDALPGQRAPSTQETESFKAFYQAASPQPSTLAPVFEITRAPGQREWKVAAKVDSAPYRAAGALCRMTQTAYAYSPRARANARWSTSGQRSFAWIDRGRCVRPMHLVELMQRIPDAELAPLIQQHAVLLQKARLLFSGNTSCAPHRSLRYRLAAIDVSAPPHGREQLHALVFNSEPAQAEARVWIRKRGAELNAWDVACGDAGAAHGILERQGAPRPIQR